VDFDHRLAAAISKVREALEDSADSPKYVETVGRRGYRFIFPVAPAEPPTLIGEADQPQAPVGLPQPAPAVRAIHWLRTIAAGFILTLVLALGLFAARRWLSPAAVTPQISSIAVLPLENLSNDPEQEYFAEGMTDEIITDLAGLPGLRVISRTSSAQYKGTHKAMSQIARELNVDGVIEGTVLRSGDRVRIRTQLIYAPADQHLWAEAYERDAKDVLSLQATLARDIAREIRLRLTSQQQAHLGTTRPVNPEAHELYLKGRFFWNKRDREGLTKAVEYFNQAVAKDPDYAAAYAGLADAYVLLGGYAMIPQAEALPKAKAAAEKALGIDDTLAEAHASLGLIAPFFDWDWREAEQQFRRAIELNPNYATAHHWYGDGYLMPMGRIDEALAEVRRARELDPLSPIIITDVGKELYLARRYDEALAELQKALELNPNFISAEKWLASVYMDKGKYKEALALVERMKPAIGEADYTVSVASVYALMGRQREARRLLARLLDLAQRKYVDPGQIASVYLRLGEKDQAFAWFEKAYAAKSAHMTSLKVWSLYDPLRSDPRFADLVRRVGLPP
jgi:TolB-like protein/Tfp pilus assembly protein PilF